MSYTTEWTSVENDKIPCRKCGVVGEIYYREWESSCGGYDDVHYKCEACGNDWWVEGADA